MGREVKRVAMDFEWPMDMVWKGYINPYRSQECKACNGGGLNPATTRIADAFYDFERLGVRWCNSVTQDEVQALVDAGRLMDFTHTWDQENRWKPKDPQVVPTADEVNAWNAGPGIGHDAINRWILVETRAKREGVYGNCEFCKGEGCIWQSDEIKAAHEAWKDFDPPTGPGYQLWSTTSDGSPMTPVFESAEALARHCVDADVSIFGGMTASYAEWLVIASGGSSPGMVMSPATGEARAMIVPAESEVTDG